MAFCLDFLTEIFLKMNCIKISFLWFPWYDCLVCVFEKFQDKFFTKEQKILLQDNQKRFFFNHISAFVAEAAAGVCEIGNIYYLCPRCGKSRSSRVAWMRLCRHRCKRLHTRGLPLFSKQKRCYVCTEKNLSHHKSHFGNQR